MKLKEIRRFRNLLRMFERELSKRLKCDTACHGVSLPQCHAILEIEAHGETTVGELAKSLGLDKSTLSRTIDGLFNIGLVKRFTHRSDRRYMSVALTTQGQTVCRQINKANDASFTDVFRAIPEEKHDAVMAGFTLLVEAMNGKRSVADGS